MSENPWKNVGEHARAIASLGMMGMYYIERVLREQDRKQLEVALDSWENEGGSGPSEVVFEMPEQKWAVVRLTNGNGRWNATGWYPHEDLFRLLYACVDSSDENVRELARKLVGRWGFV